ncbi:MAG: YidC/Oxa1 family membrane protein insertase [Firmicutes bacterium]|nr:YidC/Oxa1 family membrane protein insertase [Bacillota bacterium]
MNKKYFGLLLCVFLLTGCTKYKTYDNKSVTYEETGQKVVENILCRTDETVKKYEELKNDKISEYQEKLNNNEITENDFNSKVEEIEKEFNIDDVQKCSEFKIFSGKDGLWTTAFVKTLSWLIIKIGTITKNYGWAIIIVTLLIRLALFPITKKTAMQSENMKLAQNKLKKLEEKYRNRNDQQSIMMKNQEMLKIYKEYDINPMSGCLFALIQIPLFFAFYEALYRLPVVLEENFLGINLGLTPMVAFRNGQYYYLIFVILVILATYFSFKLNMAMNAQSETADQMKMMNNISVVMISITSFSISTGVALYWIINSGFTIVQNLLVKRGKKNDHIS